MEEIKTTYEETVRWRNVNYLIDRENELAFVPSQVRDAGMCYRNLVRRKKIQSLEEIQNVKEKPNLIRRFFTWSWTPFDKNDFKDKL